jgi:hypothetical protein
VRTQRRTWFITTLLVVALATPGAARIHAQSLSAGITAGLNISSFAGDGIAQVEFRRTPFATLSLASHAWESRFGVEGTVGYYMKGSTWADIVRNTMRLDYLEAQLLARVAIPIEGADLRPVFFVGPAVAYLVKCEMHGSFGGSALTRPCDDPSWQGTLDVNEVDWGYNFGGTVELRTRGTIVVAPRIAHTRGLQRVGFGPQDDEIEARNTSTVLGITVRVGVR